MSQASSPVPLRLCASLDCGATCGRPAFSLPAARGPALTPPRSCALRGGGVMRGRRAAMTQVHVLAEIILAGLGVAEDLVGAAVAEHLAVANHVAAVGDLQRLPHLVVGDEDGNAFRAQALDDV